MVEDGTFAKPLVEEVSHFSEGTETYADAIKFISEDDVLRQGVYDALTGDGNSYGFTTELADRTIEKQQKKKKKKKKKKGEKLTAEESTFARELNAHMSAEALDNETFMKKLVKGKPKLAEKLIARIKALQAALSKSETPGARTQRKRLAKAEKLWMQAVEEAGAKEKMKYFGANKEKEETLDNAEGEEYNGGAQFSRGNYSKARLGVSVAKYIDQKLTKNERSYIQHKVWDLYKGLSNGIANGIALENGNVVYIIDSEKDGGPVDFGVRLRKTISNEIGRKRFIDETNRKAIEQVRVSDEIVSRLGYEPRRFTDSDLRRESGAELSVDQKQSQNNQAGIRGEVRGSVGGLNDKVKFSLPNRTTDAAYLKAVEDGDMETAQRMVDEAAEKAMPNSKIRDESGNLRVVYHGTNTGDFNTFNPDYIGMSSGDDGFFGMGFYFAYSKGEASYYGAKRIISAYLNLKNPFNFDRELQTYNGKKATSGKAPDAVALMNFADKFPDIAKGITIDVSVTDSDELKALSLNEFAKAFKDVIENKQFEYQETSNEYGEKETLVLADEKTYEYEFNGEKYSYRDYEFKKRFWGEPNDLDVAYEYFSSVVYDYVDLPTRTRVILDNNREFTEAIKAKGYDGVIQSEYGDEAVSFSPNQIKSADPVTYDDKGNVIPLSKRFNTSNPDIRFSLPAKPQSAGARAKSNANRSRSKTFTREDAALIAEAVVDESTVFEARGGTYRSKFQGKVKLIDRLWVRLNEIEDQRSRDIYADKLADSIIAHTVVTLSADDPTMEAMTDRVKALKGYFRKLDLSSIKGDLKHARGGENTENRSPHVVRSRRRRV